MFTTAPQASDQIFMMTNSIKLGLQHQHVIQILRCALKYGITSSKSPNLRPDITLQGQ